MPISFPDEFWAATWASRRNARNDLMGAVLAAGLGRRLDPLTSRHLPKPLFPLGGKVPIAELWVRRFLESGITDVSMNICVLAETIRRHFRDGSKFGVHLQFVEEDVPTGTLGGICKQLIGNGFRGSTVIAPSGDIVTNFGAELLGQMHEIHRRQGAALTIVVTPIAPARRKDFGTVVLDSPQRPSGGITRSGRVTEFREKDPDSPSTWNNASIYMIERDLLEHLEALRTEADPTLEAPFYDFGKHVFPAMLGRLPYLKLPRDYLLWAVGYEGGWFDVGNKRDYLKVHQHLLDGRIDVPLTYEKLPWGYLGADASIDFSRVDIRPPVIIGNGCVIEAGATLGPYAVIGDGWVLERDAKIVNSVLWERYPYFADSGEEIPVKERLRVDRHEIRRGVTVANSIVTGGAIDRDVNDSTVDVREDGRLEILSIDYVPEGPRA